MLLLLMQLQALTVLVLARLVQVWELLATVLLLVLV